LLHVYYMYMYMYIYTIKITFSYKNKSVKFKEQELIVILNFLIIPMQLKFSYQCYWIVHNSHIEQFDLHRIKRCRFFYDNFNFRFKFVTSYECESVAVPKNRKGNRLAIDWIIIPSMSLGRPLLLKHSRIRYMVSVEDQTLLRERASATGIHLWNKS